MKDKGCVIDLIISKKLPAFVVFEDEHFIAFLDHRPVFLGHTLVCPKQHFQTFYDLPSALMHPLFSLTQALGKAVERAMAAEGSFIAMNNIISQSIPHLHVHIIPRNKGDGLKGFFWPRMCYEHDAQIIETQQKIIQQIRL